MIKAYVRIHLCYWEKQLHLTAIVDKKRDYSYLKLNSSQQEGVACISSRHQKASITSNRQEYL